MFPDKAKSKEKTEPVPERYPAEPLPTTEEPIYTNHIDIVAEEVINNLNGTFTIRIKGKRLSDEDRAILEKLYPNLCDEAYRLLNKEALLASLATPAESQRKPY